MEKLLKLIQRLNKKILKAILKMVKNKKNAIMTVKSINIKEIIQMINLKVKVKF